MHRFSPLVLGLLKKRNRSPWSLIEIQLGLHSFTAFVRVNLLVLGEKGHLAGHLVDDLFVHWVAAGLHLSPDAHFDVLVLQGKERNKVINEVPVDQAAVPQATCGRDEA